MAVVVPVAIFVVRETTVVVFAVEFRVWIDNFIFGLVRIHVWVYSVITYHVVIVFTTFTPGVVQLMFRALVLFMIPFLAVIELAAVSSVRKFTIRFRATEFWFSSGYNSFGSCWVFSIFRSSSVTAGHFFAMKAFPSVAVIVFASFAFSKRRFLVMAVIVPITVFLMIELTIVSFAFKLRVWIDNFVFIIFWVNIWVISASTSDKLFIGASEAFIVEKLILGTTVKLVFVFLAHVISTTISGMREFSSFSWAGEFTRFWFSDFMIFLWFSNSTINLIVAVSSVTVVVLSALARSYTRTSIFTVVKPVTIFFMSEAAMAFFAVVIWMFINN